MAIISSITIYRGANKGIKCHTAGSFFTAHDDLAEDYAGMNEKPCVYEYKLENLNLIECGDAEIDIDRGILDCSDEILEKYDGVYQDNSGNRFVQVILFGRVCKKGFKKLSIEEIKADANASHRRYDR